MNNQNNSPVRLIRLYSFLAFLLGAAGAYKGYVAHNIFIIIFGLLLSFFSIFLMLLKKGFLYPVIFLMVGGTLYFIFRIVTDPDIGLVKPHQDPLYVLIYIFNSAYLLIAIGVVLIPTFYIWTKREYLK